MSAILTAEKVEILFRHCLFKEGEPTDNAVKAEGIMQNYGFHPERLAYHRPEIEALLMELPLEFRKSHPGQGWSFLQACMDRHGNQWGEHIHIEQLLTLGVAIGKAKCLLPRKFWPGLPGGMPYYVVLDKPDEDDETKKETPAPQAPQS